MSTYAQDEIESDDNYDPFSDYSEFTEASIEEADMNFFRNGRLLSVGILAGYKQFTGGYSDFYRPAPVFGGYLTYFFDLQFAFQVGLMSSTHDFSFTDNGGKPFRSKVRFFDINLYAKYFFNTQNMTRAFAEWNPYLVGGLTQTRRSHGGDQVIIAQTDSAVGFDIGFGVEYLFNKKKNFAGFMLLYQYVDYSGEGSNLLNPGGGVTNLEQSGDPISVMGTIGINF